MSAIDHLSFNLAGRLRGPKAQALIADYIEESQLALKTLKRLDSLANRDTLMETYMFTQDSPGVSILVERSDVEQEATLICSGVVAAHCVGPFHTFQELNSGQSLAPLGYQYIALFAPENPYFDKVLEAVRNLHVMARLSRAENVVKPMLELVIDGEEAILASTPFSTPRNRLLEGDEPLTLTNEQDPNGILTAYAQQRGHVFLSENQVDVFMGVHLEQAGMYEEAGRGLAGPSLRAGQVVRCEVGFRIVPAGKKEAVMRIELKKVVIINANITAEMAFAQADAERRVGEHTHTVSISSNGPSGVAIRPKATVRRVKRQRHRGPKVEDEEEAELPFLSD